jgi:hypothetical protein
MCSAEGTDILTDVSTTRLAEVSISVKLCTAVRTGSFADGITTRCTKGGTRIVHGPTIGALDTYGTLHLHLLLGIRLSITCQTDLLMLHLQHSIAVILRVKCNIFVHIKLTI